MSLISSAAKLHNDVVQYESSSERKIPPSSYYVLKIKLGVSTVDIKKLAKRECSRKFGGDNKPLSVYIFQNQNLGDSGTKFQNEIYILFSSLENGEHYMGGRHHSLISDFVCRFFKKCKSKVECSIVEFDSRIKVLVYFQTKIYEGTKRVISNLLGFGEPSKDIMDMSMIEAIEMLQRQDPPVVWENMPKHDRYGTFYKEADKKYSTFSEKVNSENIEIFRRYLFLK